MSQATPGRKAGRTCVFAGPSLSQQSLPAGIEWMPPATRGALDAAISAGYTRIGFIDGAVEGGERVPLRELRAALATPGVIVLGGASMGAVRAAQLQSHGMRGVGHVFRLFARGSLTGSDEVYVLHAPAALRYRCLSLPLVNIRYTLRALRLAGRLNRAEAQAIVGYMRDIPWFDRDRHSLTAAVYATCGRLRCPGIVQSFDLLYRDIKQEDARSVVARLGFPDRRCKRRARVA